jgi:hypothetical protein
MQRTRGGTAGIGGSGRAIGLAAVAVVLLAPAHATTAQPAGATFADAAGTWRAAAAFEPIRRPASGAYDVVALRVEFQPDTTRFTTGDGTFDGALFTGGLAASIDPLPHDAAYFAAHLAFLEHYVSTVSHGRATVRTHLLPGVVRVSGRMADYSPTGPASDSDGEISKLAALTREAWSMATPSPGLPALDPERTAFVLFHAGVGRDIELLGTTLDKTPEDLPSLFFDRAALDRLAPGTSPEVGGIPVRNTLLIPRTETRQGFDFIADEAFLAEFTINGMLAASFLNFLGVPDLFDASTGESAIGPFGLMDGQGIFAMSGLFPPQPSAWTRLYLGWTDAIVVEGNEPAEVTLRHAEAAEPPAVALVPVGDGEYFLVEVRHRDPGGAGVRLTVWQGGASTEVRFENGDTSFNPQSVDGFPGGVVTAVEPYDFALPGGQDEDGVPLVGGALIWHVDERVLAEGLPTNRVNADAARRAVDLEEADGAQDIGYPTGGFFGPAFHLGSPFDFWYAGNPVTVVTTTGSEIRLYENRFGPDTVPSSASSAGGPSFVQIGDFSEAAPAMTFTVERVPAAGLEPVAGLSHELDLDASAAGSVVKPLGDGAAVFGVGADGAGALALVDAGGVRYPDVELLAAEPAVSADAVYALSPVGFVRVAADGAVQPTGDAPGGPLLAATTPVLRAPDGTLRAGVVAGDGPRVLECLDGACTLGGGLALSLALTDGGEVVTFGSTGARVGAQGDAWSWPPVGGAQRIRAAFGRDAAGFFGAVPDPSSGMLHLLRPDGSVVPVDAGPGLGSAPIVHDTNGDGLLEVVVAVGDRLWGFERSGAVAAGFPVPLRATAAASPLLVTRVDDSATWVILVATVDGHVEAVDPDRRRPFAGFPLAVGVGASPAPLIASGRLWAVSPGGRLQVWAMDEPLEDAQALADGGNTSFSLPESLDPPGEAPDGLFVASETYNWPNPVQGGPTRIRFQVTAPASVSIRILDLAGRMVDEIDVPSPDTGVPVEVTWAADVPSGVYFARVRATAPGGRSEDRLVRMAVIR